MTRSLVDVFVVAVCLMIFALSLSHAGTPAVFILGDSLYDVGTNTFVTRALAKANFPFYGIDFFNSTPNGRFSNGLNLADFTAKVALGESVTSPPPFQSLYDTGNTFSANLVKAIDFDPMRPWETPTKDFNFASMEADKENPARGINFASSGSGIIDKTSAIDVLYNLGVRKFGIFGIPYVGCVPLVRVTVLTGECSKKANDMAIQFNDKLEKLLCDMMINFKGMEIVWSQSEYYVSIMNGVSAHRSS
ncbi:SGNH hydrolase-type esterase domain-containing protein [Cynara cardunculus var. scolymus]|uniref:SGNH hydrolase-type esterase domain-containing protein n=1 Tax=Cynara cardunculus var. scolymus TaxID=59895 RepID=A0A124SDD1_CYNCS|nr:SGNH hydrolase-type esterase domain-containing protein [Cynara cardunculus var. scolymus]